MRISKARQQYIKEVKRIKRFVRDAEKRGYLFTENVIPQIPKRVTKKSLEKIINIRPKTLYEKSIYYDPILSKHVTGTEERRLIRSRASKKVHARRVKNTVNIPMMEDAVLSNLEDLISNWAPSTTWDTSYIKLKDRDKSILENILSGAISELGRKQVARNIEKNASLVKDLTFHILYGSSDFKWEDINGDIAAIAAIIRGRSLTISEAKTLQDKIDSVTYIEEDEDEL